MKLIKLIFVSAIMIILGANFAPVNAQNQQEELPPVQLWINECVRWADRMMIFYTVQNNMDQDINSFTLYVNDIPGQYDCMAEYDNGKTSYMHWNTYLRSNPSVPAHTRRKGAIMTSGVCPSSAKTATITLGGRCSDGPIVTKKNPYGEFVMRYPDVPIRGYMESNRKGVYCTNPNFQLKVNQVRRDGNRVFVNFDITSTEPDDVKFFFPLYEGAEAYLPDGRRCEVKMSRTEVPLSMDTPVQAMATITGVPQNETEIQDLTIKLESNQYDLYSAFKCVFKNLKID